MNFQTLLFKFIAVYLVLFNVIISMHLVQAQDMAQSQESSIVNYRLDQETVRRGYPVQSLDKRFTLLVLPKVFQDEVEVALQSFVKDSQGPIASYEFKISQDGQIPFLKHPLVVVFDLNQQEDYRYYRLYYYHKTGDKWLALSARRDRDRGLILSDKIDFAQGIIGLFASDAPLPDRIDAVKSGDAAESLPAEGDKPDRGLFITLGDDIIEKGYTINYRGARLAVLPGVLAAKSRVKVSFNQGIFDYDFKPVDQSGQVLAKGQNLVIVLPADSDDYHDKVIVFWDNNKNEWRTLWSRYDYQTYRVIAKSPFSFGRYKVASRQNVFVGQASWFKDSLISRTKFAAASNDYAKGANVRVVNLTNGRSVDVEILSTGPFVEGRIIDLTQSAFAQIANPKAGIIEVRVEEL